MKDFGKILKTTCIQTTVIALIFILVLIGALFIITTPYANTSLGGWIQGIIGIIMLSISPTVLDWCGKRHWQFQSSKPEVTVLYDKDGDRMIVLSSDDVDRCVNVKTDIVHWGETE